jgi:hypothetical protein
MRRHSGNLCCREIQNAQMDADLLQDLHRQKMIDKVRFYDKLKLRERDKSKYKVVRFEGGTATLK